MSGLPKRAFCWWLGHGVGAEIGGNARASAGDMGREASKRWGGDGPPVKGSWQKFRVWVVEGWFVCDELCV